MIGGDPRPGDAIVAVSSPPGTSPRGLVRVSGEGCLALLSPPAGVVVGSDLDAPPERGVVAVRLSIDFAGRTIAVPAILLRFPGPRSFTGEDSFEIAIAGHPALLEAMAETLCAAGRRIGSAVRRAEPGEFSRRAFERGRIDLSQAEGIAAAIAAEGDGELAAAAMLRRGRMHREAEAIAEGIAELLALVEAGIDFADEEGVVAIPPAALAKGLDRIASRIGPLLAAPAAEAPPSRPLVLLCGPPNAGKSALFNALLGRLRAVVSPLAGTTRDLLAEPLAIECGERRVEVLLADAAGEERADGPFGESMQSARAEAERLAALRLRCHPCDAGPPPRCGEGDLLVVTKADLAAGGAEALQGVATSARTGAGLALLREAILERLAEAAAPTAAALLERHRRHLSACLERLEEASALAAEESSAELVAAVLREAIAEASAIAGRIEPDDLLGRIFSRFCIGK